MKSCPRCHKTYDDSWGVCLSCNATLVNVEGSSISPTQFIKYQEAMNSQLEKIDERLSKLEKSAGIETVGKAKLAVQVQALEKTVPAAPVIEPEKSVSNEGDIESTIGLVWLNRIGVVALLLGAAFFLKYAFDNRWIGELGRVLLGLTAGFGMLVGSEFARNKKYDVMSQGLHGGGIGVLYLSIYASFGFYHLIGYMPAFVMMGVVTLFCGFWSVRTDWLSSAVIAIAGGFMTPLIFGMKGLSPAFLFSYIALLDLGVLYISVHKKWRFLNLLSFGSTYLLFNTWYATDYKPEQWPVAFAFASVFFGIFCLLSISHNLMRKEKSDGTDLTLVFLNGLAYFYEMLNILKPHAGGLPGLLPIGLACIYVVYSYSALKRCKEDNNLILTYVGLSTLFVTVAIPIQLKQNWVTISWALESLVLFWIGIKIRHSYIRNAAMIVGLLGLGRLVFIDYPMDVTTYTYSYFSNYAFILNERMFTYAVIVGALFIASWLYNIYKDEIPPSEKVMSTVFVILANVVLLTQLSIESQSYFLNIAHSKAALSGLAENSTEFRQAFESAYAAQFSARQLSISVLWIIYALMTITFGIYRKFRALRLMALVLFGIAVLKIFLIDLSQLDRIYRIISFVGLGVVLMLVSFFYQRFKDRLRDFALKD